MSASINHASINLKARLTINLGAVVKNWQALNIISTNALTGAVVKADAYGIGMLPVATALFNAGAKFFFVATPDEAITLRAELPTAHIFVFNGLYTGASDLYSHHKIMPVLNSPAMLEEWLEFCISKNESLPAAIHIDTGMGRLGFRMNEVEFITQKIEKTGFAPQMIMSHLACADTPAHEKNRTQLEFFKTITKKFPNIPASLANSAGIMNGVENHFQMVRPGIALYGGRAVNGRKNPMSNTVKLEAPLLQVIESKTGESIGYGSTYTLDKDSQIAIIALGYADGFLRSLSGTNRRPGGRVVINGKILPIIGRVSMDLIAIDITELHGKIPSAGDMVEILGDNITVDDQADLAGTIGYEILTSLKGRYKRCYIPPSQTTTI
jgi:alanine racemase